ncbi:MAG: hypothetical protein ACKO8Z_17870 [Prosthecobacter sp.]
METLFVSCNHCGAPLQIGKGTRFVTCQFCQSNLGPTTRKLKERSRMMPCVA